MDDRRGEKIRELTGREIGDHAEANCHAKAQQKERKGREQEDLVTTVRVPPITSRA